MIPTAPQHPSPLNPEAPSLRGSGTGSGPSARVPGCQESTANTGSSGCPSPPPRAGSQQEPLGSTEPNPVSQQAGEQMLCFRNPWEPFRAGPPVPFVGAGSARQTC